MPFVPIKPRARCAFGLLLTVCTLPLVNRAQADLRPAATTSPATSAPATNPAQLDAEIDALLKQLASEDWPTRLAAQNRLTSFGEMAEPRLKRAAHESDDAEVRARCEAALHQIADNRVVGPTLITMNVFNVHPQIAFNEIARQAGTEFRQQSALLQNPQLPQVTLDVRREPMWEVIRRVREQCGFDVEPGPFGLTIVPIPPGPDRAPTVTSGAFRVRATRISRSYAVDLTNGGLAQNEFLVHLSLQAEPKLKVSTATPLVKLEAAEDENGLSLLPGAGGGAPAAGGVGVMVPAGPAGVGAAVAMPNMAMIRGGVAVGGMPAGSAWPVTARLEYPAQGAGKRIARLKGSASCTVIVRMDTIEILDVLSATNVTKQVGATSVTVRSCRKVAGEQYELTLNIGADGGGPGLAPFVQRAIRPPGQGGVGIRIVDANGRDLPQMAMRRMSSAANGRTDVTMVFGVGAGGAAQAVAGPLKLLWEVPSEMRDFDVPFEFLDLPLP